MSVNKKSTFDYAHVFFCFSLDLTHLSPRGNCTGEIYIGECVEWWQRTRRKKFTATAHSAIPNFFPNYFPPCHAQRLVWALRVNHQIFPPFVPYTLPKYLAVPIPPHVVWKTDNATPKANGQMLFPGAPFAQILAYSQFHKFLPMITNHRGWWMVRGVIGASSCPTKPSTAVNQLQPKSCRKPPKRTTPYHVVHFITSTTCVIPWQPGANHGNLVTAIIPALLWQVYCRRWNPLCSCTWQLALPWTTQKKATPFFEAQLNLSPNLYQREVGVVSLYLNVENEKDRFPRPKNEYFRRSGYAGGR